MLKPKIIFASLVIVFLVAAVIFMQIDFSISPKKFSVTFLNVGQGDAALIQFGDGEKMLVDCGPDKLILSALGRNLRFFDRSLDYVLITHPDLDHYGGCIDVVKNYNVHHIIVNGKEKPNDQYFQEWSQVARGHPTKVINGHETMNIASSTIEFFSPDASLPLDTKSNDSNNYSIVFRLSHGAETFLFTGDMEEPLEKLLVQKYCSSDSCPLRSDVLKVGHHGSDGASSELFLSYVHPKTAIISVGKNKFGHPTLRAIKHLERAGANILRTDQSGDIELR